MFRGIGLDLGAIERDVPQARQARGLAQLEHLNEQTFQGLQMPLAEVAHRAEVGLVQGRDRHEVHAFNTGFGNAPGGIDTLTVAVE